MRLSITLFMVLLIQLLLYQELANSSFVISVAQSLPDIWGFQVSAYIPIFHISTNGYGGAMYSGDLYQTTTQVPAVRTNYTNDQASNRINFSASRCNNTYGRTPYVQPLSSKCKYFIKYIN